MSIATKILELQQAKEAIADAIEAKGVDTTGHGLADFADDIGDIQTGGTDARVEKIVVLKDGTYDLDISDINIVNILRPYAFYNKGGYNGLKSIKLPSSVHTIGAYAFNNQQTLEQVITNGHLRGIESNAFRGCIALQAIAIDNATSGITIEESAFFGCTSLSSLILPASLPTGSMLSVGNAAFRGCNNLALSQLPTNYNVRLITNSFAGSGISISEIPANVDVDNNSSQFSACPNLTTLKIKCAALYRMTFAGCTNLSKVWISSNCTDIRDNAVSGWVNFNNCTSLTDIYCEPASQPSGWTALFANTSASTAATVHWGVSESEFDEVIGA